MNNTLSLDASFPLHFIHFYFIIPSPSSIPSLHHHTPLFKSSEMSAIVRNECYSRRGAYAPPLTPSVKGGGSVAPYIPHLYILIMSLPTSSSDCSCGAKGTYGFPFNPSLQLWARGQRGQVRIPPKSLQIFSSIKPAWRRGGFQGT